MINMDEFDQILAAASAGGVDAAAYQDLSGRILSHPRADRLLALDPFSADYKAEVLRLYADLRRDDRTYEPGRDEQSGAGMPANLWTDLSPWSFRDAGFISEFFLSWGQIMRALALPQGSTASVLEYGSGSGQLALFLARLGLRVSVVDIDAASLATVRAQADALGFEVRAEQAAFGEGFAGERFDRIIFFEAFHHAIDFSDLLLTLRRRLNPGGLLILCGEPVVDHATPGVPYPWGPRLDALSVYCIRKYGWMELGFTRPFLIEALHRRGWLVEVCTLADCFRATTYVARPYVGEEVEVGRVASLGLHDAGWHGPEGEHRWTKGGEVATFPLPDRDGPMQVSLRVSNHLPVAQRVEMSDGARVLATRTIGAGEQRVEIVLDRCVGSYVGLHCAGARPIDVVPGSIDDRSLGIAVHAIRVGPAGV